MAKAKPKDKPATQPTRMVPDPSMSDAQFIYERRMKPGNPKVGMVEVADNPFLRIGALAYVHRRTPTQERAAEMFKSAYEALYGSGAPAIDPSVIRVDRTIMAHDAGMAGRIDRGARIRQVEASLPKADWDRVVAVLVLGRAPKDIMAGSGKRQLRKEVDALLDTLDLLAAMWGLMSRAA